MRNEFARIKSFLMRPQPCELLGYWRVIFGLNLLVIWFLALPDASMFWGAHAFVSATSMLNESHGPSLFWYFADQDLALTVLGLTLLISLFAFCVGFYTRTAAWISFVCVLSFHSRNPHILNLGDRLLREMLLFAALSPCGKAISIDARRAPERDSLAPQWAVRLLQIQISAVYLVTFLIKLHGDDWLNGTAVYYSSRLLGLSEHRFAFLFDNLYAIHAMTWGTLLLEFALAVLIWIPCWRNVLILIGLIFHVALLGTTTIPRFEETMLLGLLLFIDPRDFQIWVARMSASLQKLRPNRSY